MSKFNSKLAGGMAAAVALATGFTTAHATTTPLYGGGSTLAEKVYRDVFDQYGANASGDLCFGRPSTYCATTPYRSNVEGLYVGVGSGNGKKSLVNYDASLEVSGSKKPDNPPVPSGRDFGTFYGTGQGSTWAPGTGVGPYYPKVTFAGSDDPLTSGDVATYNNKFGPLIQLPGLAAGVAVGFNPTAGWNPQGTLLTGGSSKVNLSTNTICGIFTGAITTWNNAEITKDNKGKVLGTGTITVVYRHDGSGTTFLFTNALLNQCGTQSNPVSTHPFPDAWLTATVQGTAITYNPTPTPLNSYFTSNNNFYINVFNHSLLPSNFYNDNNAPLPGSGGVGGCSGSGGVQKCLDATAGAIAYISPDFIQPVTTGNDKNGNPVAAAANVQTYYSYTNHLTAKFVAPTATAVSTIMTSAAPPSTTGGASSPAANPLNWGVVNPLPTGAAAYPFGGFTFLDFYSCYGDAATVDALVGKTAGSLGYLRWYYGSSTVNGGIPATTLHANGFALPPGNWISAMNSFAANKLLTINKAGATGTQCASISKGA